MLGKRQFLQRDAVLRSENKQTSIKVTLLNLTRLLRRQLLVRYGHIRYICIHKRLLVQLHAHLCYQANLVLGLKVLEVIISTLRVSLRRCRSCVSIHRFFDVHGLCTRRVQTFAMRLSRSTPGRGACRKSCPRSFKKQNRNSAFKQLRSFR